MSTTEQKRAILEGSVRHYQAMREEAQKTVQYADTRLTELYIKLDELDKK